MVETISLSFPNGRLAHAAAVTANDNPYDVSQVLGLRPSRLVLVMIGGAGNLDSATAARLRKLFQDAIAPLAQQLNILVIDGGTDTGIIRLIGQARQAINGQFDLLGIAPLGKVKLPLANTGFDSVSSIASDAASNAESPTVSGSSSPGGHPLEVNHTHFIFVPGTQWGDESAWLARFAQIFSGKAPATTVLINGGDVSLIDLQENLATGCPAIVIAGSGRLADRVANAIEHPNGGHKPDVEQLVANARNQLVLFDLLNPLDEFVTLLRQLMATPT